LGCALEKIKNKNKMDCQVWLHLLKN